MRSSLQESCLMECCDLIVPHVVRGVLIGFAFILEDAQRTWSFGLDFGNRQESLRICIHEFELNPKACVMCFDKMLRSVGL